MATKERLEKGIVALKGQIDAAETSEERQVLLDKMAILADEYRKIEGQAQPDDSASGKAIEELRENKNDVLGFMDSITTSVNRGILQIPNLPSDVLNMALSAFGAPPEIRAMRPTDAVDWLSDKLTGFRPIERGTTPSSNVDTPAERMVGTVAEYVSSGLGVAAGVKNLAEIAMSRRFTSAAPVSPVAEAIAPARTSAYTQEAGQQLLAQASRPGYQRAATSAKEFITQPSYMRSEAIASLGAGALAAPAREYAAEAPYVEFVASLLGGITPTAAGAVVSKGKDLIGEFTRKGAENRVSKNLTDKAYDAAQALENIQTNRKVVEAALPEGARLDPARLSEDPGIIEQVGAAVNAISNDNSSLAAILARQTDDVGEQVMGELEAAASAGDPNEFVTALNTRTNKLIESIEDDIDLAKNQADRIEAENTPQMGGEPATGTQISEKFVQALEASYQRAKAYESKLWSLVDKRVKMDGKRLRVMGLRLRNQLLRRGFSREDVAIFDNEFKFFGASGPTGRNTFESLQMTRSRLLEQKRAAIRDGNRVRAKALGEFDQLLLEFINTGPNRQAYAAAAEATNTIHNSYNRGKLGKYLNLDAEGDLRIDPEVALDRVVRGGRDIGEVRRAIAAEETVAGPRGAEVPGARGLTRPIQDKLMMKFLEAPTPKARAKFLKDYAETLNEFPELARDLSVIQKELDTLAEVAASKEGRIATLNDKNKTSVAALIGADPDNIFGSLKGLQREQVEDIYNVAVQEGVEGGLQSVYLQEIVQRMQSTVVDGGDFRTLDKVLLGSDNRSLKYGYDVVLTNEQRNVLSQLNKTIKLLNQKLGQGKDVALFEASAPVRALAQFFSLRMASKVSPPGPAALKSASIFSNIAKTVVDAMPSQQRTAVLVKAIQDPDYFESLLKLQASQATVDQKIGQFETLLRQVGIRVGTQLERAAEQEQRQEQ